MVVVCVEHFVTMYVSRQLSQAEPSQVSPSGYDAAATSIHHPSSIRQYVCHTVVFLKYSVCTLKSQISVQQFPDTL